MVLVRFVSVGNGVKDDTWHLIAAFALLCTYCQIAIATKECTKYGCWCLENWLLACTNSTNIASTTVDITTTQF
jgi:hypothetical protein